MHCILCEVLYFIFYDEYRLHFIKHYMNKMANKMVYEIKKHRLKMVI